METLRTSSFVAIIGISINGFAWLVAGLFWFLVVQKIEERNNDLRDIFGDIATL